MMNPHNIELRLFAPAGQRTSQEELRLQTVVNILQRINNGPDERPGPPKDPSLVSLRRAQGQ